MGKKAKSTKPEVIAAKKVEVEQVEQVVAEEPKNFKISKIIVTDQDNKEYEIEITDCTMLATNEQGQTISQFSKNAALNMQLLKFILKD